MKKKIIIVSILCVLCIGLISGILFLDNKNVVLENEKTKKSKNNNQISMMLETAKDSNVYEASSDNTFPISEYIFNETLSKCENGGTISWDDSKQKAIVKNNISDKCYVYFDVAPDEIKLADYIKSLYTSQGTNNLYLHDSTLANGAGDNSYRYAGSSDTTNNFVCFGYDSTDGTCPTDYLYRIIGVFDDQVKLIKYDYAKASLLGTNGDYMDTYSNTGRSGTNQGENLTTEIGVYYWNNNTENNTWSESNLNVINLNTNFINNIGSDWIQKISLHSWIVGGNTWENVGNSSVTTSYKNEITSPAEETIYQSKIGLMYVSDYGYSALPSAWTTILNDFSENDNTSWMYMGLYEWSLTPRSDGTSNVLALQVSKDFYFNYVLLQFAVRPVFYLISDTVYSGGNGTASTPYLIK